MLFDLRGRGRRRTVQVIYAGLALLIGAGLVFFGVGAGIGGGGLLNSLTGNEEHGATSFASQVSKYKKLTQKQPSSVYAWEQLTLAQLHEGGGEAYFADNKVTSKGEELFAQVAKSWNRYIALNPPKPNVEMAQEMVRVFGEEGLDDPAEAVKVLQIVTAARPESASFYAALAEYAYKAHNTRIGDLASEKAVALAPAAQRKRLKAELAELKKQPSGPEYTTRGANGQPVKVRKSSNGTYTGVETKPAATQPGGLPTTTK